MLGGFRATLSRMKRFCRDQGAAVGAFFVITIPALLLVGGLATDISLLNAQKRHVQSQADLAAVSAVRLLPDATKVRARAQSVVSANLLYDSITLGRNDVIFGTLDSSGTFNKVANQTTGAGATTIQVKVASQFAPILLGPVMGDQLRMVSRSAYASRESVAVFTLRNRLLAVDTNESLLNPVFSQLGLGLQANAIGYQGLANADVSLQRVLGLASAQVGLRAPSLTEALALPVSVELLLRDLVAQGALPAAALPSTFPNRTIVLGDFIKASSGAAAMDLGQVVSPITVNAFDLLLGILGRVNDPNARISIRQGLDLSPLGSVEVTLGLIRPPVTVIVRPGDPNPPKARMAQVSLGLVANILGQVVAGQAPPLLRLSATVDLGTAEAALTNLNCAASSPSDVIGTFNVTTGVSEVSLQLGVLQTNTGIADKNVQKLQVSSSTQQVSVRRDQLGLPVKVNNYLLIAPLVTSLTQTLNAITTDITSTVKANACAAGFLSLLTCPLFTVVDAVVTATMSALNAVSAGISWLINNLGVEKILQAVLDLLGIKVAQAELILEGYSCSGRLMR